MIKNPRKLDGTELKPTSLSIDLNITPLSTATMNLMTGEKVAPRTYVELFTINGSAGVFRTRTPCMGVEQSSTIQLDHAIAEVGDSIVVADIEEESTVSTGIAKLWTHYKGSKWQLGSIASGSTAVTLKANYDTVLDSILDVLEQVPSLMLAFDFSTTPWTVSVVARDTTVSAEGRIGRNVKSARITEDDSELCTRVYVDKLPGTSGSTYGHIDADTISIYGVIEKELSGADNATQASRIANTYLDKHKRPIYSVEIEAVDLSKITGETLDSFAIGRKYRLALPKYGVTVEETITTMRYTNVYANPNAISLVLSEEPDTVVNYIKKSGRASRSTAKTVIKKDKEYETKFEQTDHYIDLWAGKTATNGDILEQAGMYLDSSGVLIYATDNANMVGSKFQVQSNRIGMVIGTYQGQDYIKAGEIALAINSTTGESTALINANHVNISATNTAYTLAGELERDANGKLIIKSAGGMYVRKTESGVTSEFGVWDRGNLTGGVMVEQINGQTTTHITGDHINISADNTVRTLAGAMETDANGKLVIKSAGGMYVRKTISGVTSEFGVWDNNNLTAGVVATIVNGESSTYIYGSKIQIGNSDATTVINGKCSLSDVTADYISSKIATLSVLNVAAISATGNIHTSNGYIMAPYYYLGTSGNARNLASSIWALQIVQSGNTYTLQAQDFDDTGWVDVGSFSRAVASWTMGWSNGVFTAKANPQNQSCNTTIVQGATSWNGNTATVPVNAYDSDNPSYTYATGRNISVDASARYTAGYNAGVPAGKAAVTLVDPTWNSSTGALPSSRTVTVSTTGRTNASGTTENLSKSVPLYLTASGLTVSMRTNSTTGTAYAQISCSDANLVAGNIKSGVSIFGVTGTYTTPLTWEFPNSPSTGSSEPTGTFAKSYTVSMAGSNQWMWIRITVNGEAKRIKFKILKS